MITRWRAVLGAVVTAGLFRALGTRPLLRRVFLDQDDRPDVARTLVSAASTLLSTHFAAQRAEPR